MGTRYSVNGKFNSIQLLYSGLLQPYTFFTTKQHKPGPRHTKGEKEISGQHDKGISYFVNEILNSVQ